MRRSARRLDGPDLIEHLAVATGEERTPVDHHVHLARARPDREFHVGELHLPRGAPRGERRGHGRDTDSGTRQRLDRRRGQIRVHAHRGDRWCLRAVRVGATGLGAQCADLALGVGAFERGEVDHPDRGVDRPQFRGLLDAPGAEPGGALLQTDLVDSGQSVQEPPQRTGVLGRVAQRVRQRGCGRGCGHGRESKRWWPTAARPCSCPATISESD